MLLLLYYFWLVFPNHSDSLMKILILYKLILSRHIVSINSEGPKSLRLRFFFFLWRSNVFGGNETICC